MSVDPAVVRRIAHLSRIAVEDKEVERLNGEITRFLHSTEAKEKFLSVGIEAAGTSPEQLTATMTAEMSRMGKVIRDAGIRDD